MKPGDVDDPKAGLVEHVGNIKNLTVLDEKWSSLAFCFAKELIHYELRVSLDSSGRVDYVYSDQIESLVQIAVRFLFETAYRDRQVGNYPGVSMPQWISQLSASVDPHLYPILLNKTSDASSHLQSLLLIWGQTLSNFLEKVAQEKVPTLIIMWLASTCSSRDRVHKANTLYTRILESNYGGGSIYEDIESPTHVVLISHVSFSVGGICTT